MWTKSRTSFYSFAPLAPEFNIEIHGIDFIILDLIMFVLLDDWPQSILNMGVKGVVRWCGILSIHRRVMQQIHPTSDPLHDVAKLLVSIAATEFSDFSDVCVCIRCVGFTGFGAASTRLRRFHYSFDAASTISIMFAAEQANCACLCRFSQ